MEIKKAPNEFIEDGDIPDGANMLSGDILSSDKYGVVRDIPILSDREKQMCEPLTSEEQFVLRSELWGLILADRFTRSDASYGASVSALTSASGEGRFLNPIDSESISDFYLSKSTEVIQHKHIKCLDGFMAKYSMWKRANLLNIIKRPGESKTHFRVRNFLYLQKKR